MGTGALSKLKIISYSDAEQNSEVGTFEAYYNPTSFTATYALKYAEDKKASTDLKHEMRYMGYAATTYAFELLLDGTGASGPSGSYPKGPLDVDKAIKDFQKMAYGYEGAEHRGSYLKLVWGDALSAVCVVLSSVTITRDLFKSDGKTLRAKLNCQFTEFSYEDKTKAEKSDSSPDLTHVRIVTQGDRLPLMCEKIYGDDRLYLQVARYNGLSNYRKLTPGQKIYFPPLVTK